MTRVAAAIPAFQAGASVADVVRRTREVLPDVLVVDDGSSDATAEAARDAGAELVAHAVNRGKGAALVTAFRTLFARGFDAVVTVDADGQHLPEELPIVIGPIVRGEADYVNGSRLLGYFEKGSTIRHLGVHFFSRVVTILTGQRVTDISSGYRAARADLLRDLVLEQDQFWTSEILIEALRHHARIVEVPITILARKGGKSKKPKSLKYGWNFSKVIIQTWLR